MPSWRRSPIRPSSLFATFWGTSRTAAPDAVSSISAPANSGVSLDSLRPGRSASVVGVDGSSPAGERLLDLGFVPGTSVEILKRAPLGDPVIYGLRGYRICLRATEAGLVRVRPE